MRMVAASLLALCACGGPAAPAPAVSAPPPPPPDQSLSGAEIRDARAARAQAVVVGTSAAGSRLVDLRPGQASIRVASPSPATLSVSAMGSGAADPSTAAAARVASLPVAVALGLPFDAVALSVVGRSDLSSSAAVAVAGLAAHLGTSVEDSVILGAVDLEGRLWATGGERALAESMAGSTARFIVPPGLAAELRRVAGSARVVPARTVVEAYRAATGDPLPETDSSLSGPDRRADLDFDAAVGPYRQALARDYALLVRLSGGGRAPAGLLELGASALADARQAEGASRAGDGVMAWSRMRRALVTGSAASLTYRVLLLVQERKLSDAVAVLRDRREQLSAALSSLPAASALSFEGQIALVGQAAARHRAESWLAQADRRWPEAEAFLASLETLAPRDEFAVETVARVGEHVAPLAQALSRAEEHIQEARRAGQMTSTSTDPAVPAGSIDTLVTSLAAYADALVSLGPESPASPTTEAEVILAQPVNAELNGLPRLGALAARIEAATRWQGGAAQLDAALRQLGRAQRRATIVLGTIPAELAWRQAIAARLRKGDAGQRERAALEARRATILAIIALELALIEPPRPASTPTPPT